MKIAIAGTLAMLTIAVAGHASATLPASGGGHPQLARNEVVLPSQRPAYLAENSVVLPSQRPAYLA
jgi:hypothetical protein